MSIQSSRLQVSNQTLSIKRPGPPKDLDEAKAQDSQRSLDDAALGEANNLLTAFQRLAGQLAGIDNKDKQPMPKAPGTIEGWIHPERVKNFQAEKARLEAFNGKDLSPAEGHVLTTAANNNAGRDAEMVFNAGAQFAEKPHLLESVASLRVENAASVYRGESLSQSASGQETWNFSQQGDKLVYEHQRELKDAPQYSATRTLTHDPKSGEATYSSQSNLDEAPANLFQYTYSRYDDYDY